MSLHPVAGHGELLASLARAHARDDLPSVMLFHGPRGVGKQRTALWVAQLVVCHDPATDGPCGRCGPCRMALKLEHPDVHWYFPLERPKRVSGDRLAGALEDARMHALADLREEPIRPSHADELRGLYLLAIRNIKSRAHVRPTMAVGQVFIVGDAELLVPQESSPEAANALLKLLEEPPGASRFILTSSEPGRLLPTILSRTVALHVPPLPLTRVSAFLTDTVGVEPEVAQRAAQLSQGSIGRALGFLPDGDQQGPLESLRRHALTVVEAALASGPAKGYAVSLGYPPAGARRLIPLFAFVEEWLRDLGAVASGAGDRVFNQDALSHLEKLVQATPLLASRVTQALPEVEEARELARGNVNPQLVVDGLVRRLRSRLVAQGNLVSRGRPVEVA